ASTAIVNGGTIKKSAGTSGSTFNVPLTLQSGSQLLVQNTILYLGNVTSNGGTLDVSSGATAYFYYTTASSFDAASTISGAGTVQWGAGTNSVSGVYNVTGTTKNSATTTIGNITSVGSLLVNAGTINITSGGTTYLQNNAVLTNSGTIDLQSDGSVILNGGASTAIVNAGTIKKSAGASGSTFNVPLTLQSGSQFLVQNTIVYF